jgi:hypothetical protein
MYTLSVTKRLVKAPAEGLEMRPPKRLSRAMMRASFMRVAFVPGRV